MNLTRLGFCLMLAGVAVIHVAAKGGGSKLPRANSRKDGNVRGKSRSSSEKTGGNDNTANNELDSDPNAPRLQYRNSSHEERLLDFLFQQYDPVARGVMNTQKPVFVSIDFVLLRIHGLDERSQVLTTTGLIIAEWSDERLVWRPSEFGNLTNIIVKADGIWLPEIAVMNGADELIPDFERIRVLLHSDGRLHWEPGGIFRTTCDIDIAFFPFDRQHCPLLMGAYSYYSSKMNITNASTTISTHDFRVNGEWSVQSTSAEWGITVLNNCSGDGYSHVVFTLNLERRCKFYIMNIVLPCVMLSVLIMIGFCLPPDAGEKISLGISVLLAFTVFLLMIADTIPRTSLAIPLIVTYLMATMTLGTVSICMTVLVLNVHHRGPRYQIPPWVRKLVLVYIAKFVCVKTSYGRPPPSQNDDVWKRRSRRLSSTLDGLDDVTISDHGTNNKQSDYSHPNGPSLPSSAMPFLCAIQKRRSSERNCEKMDKNKDRTRRSCTSGSSSEEWHELARVLDRLFFWLLFAMMTLSAMSILLYPKYASPD